MNRRIIGSRIPLLLIALLCATSSELSGPVRAQPTTVRKEMKFKFVQQSSRAALDASLRAKLAVKQTVPETSQQVALKALPLDDANMGLLSGVMAKKLQTGKVQHARVTKEQFVGSYYTAAIAYIYARTEKKYEETSKGLSPKDQTDLKQKWNKETADLVGYLRAAGMPQITEQQLKAMGDKLRNNAELYSAMDRVMGQRKPQEPAATSGVVPQSVGMRMYEEPSVRTPQVSPVTATTDLCTTPHRGSRQVHFGYKQNITLHNMPCVVDWTVLFGVVRFNCDVTVASIDVSLDVTIGYTIDCQGGTAWASGVFDASTDVPYIGSIGVHLSAEASGLLEYGKAVEGSSCVYDFAVATKICGRIFDYDLCVGGPTEGFSVNAPCAAPRPPLTWTIEKPNVKNKATVYDGVHASPKILFQEGDRITITAGGCVQRGGDGKTWKRYVNPSGKNSDKRWFGLISIQGITKGLVPIRSIPGQFESQRPDVYTIRFPAAFPGGVPEQQRYLTLGYEDNKYSDNGYYSHDNGTENQCKECGNAFVRITVIRANP